jgi:hypothetical protein
MGNNQKYQTWTDAERDLGVAIRRNNGEFPSQRDFRKMGYNSLVVYVQKNYGGLGAAREMIGFPPVRGNQRNRKYGGVRELKGMLALDNWLKKG